MNDQSMVCEEANSVAFGFMCPQTQVFYAFSCREEYEQFLDWMAQNQEEGFQQSTVEPLTDEEMLKYSERATESILSVLDDVCHVQAEAWNKIEEYDF